MVMTRFVFLPCKSWNAATIIQWLFRKRSSQQRLGLTSKVKRLILSFLD